MQLVLDVISGNDGVPKVHAVLYFTMDSARALVSECMICSHDRYSAKSKSLKRTNVGTCFYTSHMLGMAVDASTGAVYTWFSSCTHPRYLYSKSASYPSVSKRN